MAFVIKTKNKQQEKVTVAYTSRTKRLHGKKEKGILKNLEESVEFVNKHKKGKAKSLTAIGWL